MIDFTDADEGAALNQEAIDWLLGSGVTIDILAMPWAVRSARVTFEPTGHYRPCPGIGHFAYIIAVIDDGIVDLVAWSPTDGRLATRVGYGFALGQGQITHALLTTAKLKVRRDPLDWLRNHRDGIAIIDPVLAARALADLDLDAEDASHAEELTALLRSPPRISFPDFARTAS